MANLSDEPTAKECEVSEILLALRLHMRVPISDLCWGERRSRSTGELHGRLRELSGTVNLKSYGDEKCGGDGWPSPDTPLQFLVSEDDDAGRVGKSHLDVLDKPHKELKRKYKELHRENKQILMKISTMREHYKELQQLNLDLKARMALQDRLQSNSARPSVEINRATTIPLPATTPARSDHIQPQPQKSCRRQPIPDLNMPPEEVAAVAPTPTTKSVAFSGYDWPYSRPTASKGSATQAARKRRMDIRRSKNSIFSQFTVRHS